MAKRNKYKYSQETLEQVLKLNPEAVSFESLSTGFGFKVGEEKKLREALADLEEKGLVRRTKRGRYQSTNPISDVVIARVTDKTRGKTVEIELLGIQGKQPFLVTLPMHQIRKLEKKEGRKLGRGSKVAVVLERTNGLELKSRNLIGRVDNGKKLHLTVAFSKAVAGENPVVTSVTPISLTEFAALGKIPEQINFRKDFSAALPPDYSPYAPSLEVEDARWDPKTGLPIYAIVANKNNIPERHSPEAELEAQRILTANFWQDKSRRDLRNERILVIDPPNAHDNDDGILIEHTDKVIDGQRAYYRTLVVIADVPFYVRPGSQMEKEAQERGFTHYFDEGHALHLYPSVFADSKSSLKSGRVRPVIYVEKFWDMDGKQMGEADIGTGIIESQKVMTYGQFQYLIDSDDPSVWSYQELGDKFIQQYRHEEGLVFDSINNDPNASYARALVASMMQDTGQELANMLHHCEVPFLRRAHGAKDNLYAYEECRDALRDMGYYLSPNPFEVTIRDIQEMLAEAEARQERSSVERYVKQYLLNQAKYTTIDMGHYALNKKRYTHGTSPIRRYPDLLTLRGIHTALGNDELGLSENDIETMQDIAEKMNRLQDVQKTVALDYERYNSVARLAAYEGLQRNVILSGIKYPYVYIDVTLGKRGALRKELKISELPGTWTVNKAHNKLVYRGQVEVPIGTAIRATIRDVKPETGDWNFDDMIPTPKSMSASMKNGAGKALVAKVL